MTRGELVQRAISFDRPSRVPVWYWNADRERSDIHSFELFPYKGDVNRSEWGYVWENLGDGTIGQPKKPVTVPVFPSLFSRTWHNPRLPCLI